MDFYNYATRWSGAPATIVPDPGREVWGAIWEIDSENLADLDHQEGVHKNVYKPLQMPIETPSGKLLNCRVYQLVNVPGELQANQTVTKKPSHTYIEVLISGALESALPVHYVNWLKSIEHNGQHGIPELVNALNEHLASIKSS